MGNTSTYRFEELPQEIKGKTVFLDIDGTVALDSATEVEPAVLRKVEELKMHNTLYLCTNSRNKQRNNEISKALSVPIANSEYRKPSKKILQEVMVADPAQIVVIGDKWITDGLFAQGIGAQFIKVQKRVSGQERAHIKLYNWTDDVVYSVVKLFTSS